MIDEVFEQIKRRVKKKIRIRITTPIDGSGWFYQMWKNGQKRMNHDGRDSKRFRPA